MNSVLKEWLKNNNFVLVDNNQGLDAGLRTHLMKFLSDRYSPDCVFYVQVVQKNIEYEQRPEFNHFILYAFVAVGAEYCDEPVDFIMVNLIPNIIRLNEDMIETAEIVDHFFELQEKILELGTSNCVA